MAITIDGITFTPGDPWQTGQPYMLEVEAGEQGGRVPVTSIASAATGQAFPARIYVTLGAPYQLDPVPVPANATEPGFTFLSSNPSIAAVSAGGLITPARIGSAAVQIKSNPTDNVNKAIMIQVQ